MKNLLLLALLLTSACIPAFHMEGGLYGPVTYGCQKIELDHEMENNRYKLLKPGERLCAAFGRYGLATNAFIVEDESGPRTGRFSFRLPDGRSLLVHATETPRRGWRVDRTVVM